MNSQACHFRVALFGYFSFFLLFTGKTCKKKKREEIKTKTKLQGEKKLKKNNIFSLICLAHILKKGKIFS